MKSTASFWMLRGVVGFLFLSVACGDSGRPHRDDGNDAGHSDEFEDAGPEGPTDVGGEEDASTGADAGDDEIFEPVQTELGQPKGSAVNVVIGAAGGTVVSSDGVLEVEIPAGALSADTTIGIQPIGHTAPGGVGDVYELTPEGLTFEQPVTLRFKYTEATTAGSAPAFLAVAVQNEERFWELQLDNAELDERASTLSVNTTHFSRWGVVQHVHLVPSSATVMTKELAHFYVNLCADLSERSPGTLKSVMVTTCRKMPVRYAAAQLSNWAVNGITGGNSTVGTVTSQIEDGYYQAPATKPDPATVTVSVDGKNPFTGEVAQLTAEVEIIDANRPYIGYFAFTTEGGGSIISVDADITWVPFEDLGDVRSYRVTGTARVEVRYADCNPATTTLSYDQDNAGGQLVIYTETNSAFPNQYQFAAVTQGTIIITCDDRTIELPVLAQGLGGSCNGGPPFAPMTNENHLHGSEPCPLLNITSTEWSFVRDQSED